MKQLNVVGDCRDSSPREDSVWCLSLINLSLLYFPFCPLDDLDYFQRCLNPCLICGEKYDTQMSVLTH